MIRTSSSSSTLSPLAPPFTVDNYRYRYPPHPPSTLPELNGNGSFNGEALPVRSVDKSSSWIDPSVHYNASPLSAGHVAENFMAYVDGYGTWHGNHADSTENQAKIGVDSSAFQTNYDNQNTDTFNSEYSYFHSPNLNPAVKECHTSNSNSSYDRYISQLVTSSSDSFTHYPPKTCFSSSSMYSIPKNAHSSILSYEVDDNYLDYMLLNKTPPSSNRYIDNRGDHVEASSENKEVNGDEVTTEAIIPNFSAKLMNFTESVSLPRTNSAEYFDQPNQNEDSPCWKGASKFRECLFDDVNLHDGVQCIKTSLDVRISEIDDAEGSPNKNNERKDLTKPIHEGTATLSTNGTVLHESSQNKLFDLNFEAILDQISTSAACVKERKNVTHLVKAMHYISEALLSSSYDSDVEESDHDLIKLVVTNLDSFASRSKKDTTASVGNSFDMKRPCGTAQQVSVADLESDVFDKKESNPQTLLYKNLWMQAEASLCSLKYELQLTRMKLDMESFECGKKVMDPVQTKKSPILESPQNYDTNNEAEKSNIGGESVESSIMARLEIIRGRYAQSNDTGNMFNNFADLGFVPQVDEDENSDDGLTMAPGSFLPKFSNELDFLYVNSVS